jgi:hypothetical protein
VADALYEFDIVRSLEPLLPGPAVGGLQPIAPESLRCLHSVKTIPVDGFAERVGGAAPQRIAHGDGEGRGSLLPNRIHDACHLLRSEKGTNGVVHEDDLDMRGDGPEGISDACLARRSALHDGTQFPKLRFLKAIAHAADIILRHGDHEVTDSIARLKGSERAQEQRVSAERAVLLARFPAHSRACAGSRDKHRDVGVPFSSTGHRLCSRAPFLHGAIHRSRGPCGVIF